LSGFSGAANIGAVSQIVEFRTASPADAEAIADLIASFQSELTDDPSGAGAEEYLASVSVQAEREYLASERYRYLLAYSESQLAGFIAIRDGSHLFHLFVARSHQRQGIARRLWERARRQLCAPNSNGGFTVNSSLSAVPVYEAFGFVPTGSIQRMHGISFLPMRRPHHPQPIEQRGEPLNSPTGQHDGKH
jgi:GNAT superfamily N-acetyltransferase